MCGENSCNCVFLLLVTVRRALTFAMLCRRAVLLLWHAFLFLGLRPVGFPPPSIFLFCLVVATFVLRVNCDNIPLSVCVPGPGACSLPITGRAFCKYRYGYRVLSRLMNMMVEW
jgi:hypothetical protein